MFVTSCYWIFFRLHDQRPHDSLVPSKWTQLFSKAPDCFSQWHRLLDMGNVGRQHLPIWIACLSLTLHPNRTTLQIHTAQIWECNSKLLGNLWLAGAREQKVREFKLIQTNADSTQDISNQHRPPINNTKRLLPILSLTNYTLAHDQTLKHFPHISLWST